MQHADVVGNGPCVDIGALDHLAAQRAVLIDIECPRGIPVPDVGDDLVRLPFFEVVSRIAAGGKFVAGAVEPDLECFVMPYRTVGPFVHAVAVDAIDAETDRGAFGADGRTPPCAAGRTRDVLEDLLAVFGVDVVDVRMGVGRHDCRIFILRQQLQHFVVVFILVDVISARRRTAAKRNMDAENDHLLFRHETQVLPEPFVLFIGKSGVVIGAGLTAVDDVVHRNDVHVSPIERIVGRAEEALVFCPRRRFVGRRIFMVVVADGGENRQSGLFRLQGDHHVGEERPFVVHMIPQRDPVTGDIGFRDVFADLSSRFVFEPHGMRSLVYLRIADTDQVEPCFGRGQRLEREVIAGRSLLELCEEGGELVGLVHIDLVGRG